MSIILYDAIDLSQIPADAPAVAGYTSGRWPTYARLRGQFPRARLLSIAVTAGSDADILDIETGDATPAQAPAWYLRQKARGAARPGLYASASVMEGEVLPRLAASGIPRAGVRLWSAHYTGIPHICAKTTCGATSIPMDGTQWTNRARGRDLDESLLAADFFGTPPAPAPPKPVPSPIPAWQEALMNKLPVLTEGATDVAGHVFWVHRLQALVKVYGEITDVADAACQDVNGHFDAATATAVRAVQAHAHITADAVVGPQTWGVLIAGSASLAQPLTVTPPADISPEALLTMPGYTTYRRPIEEQVIPGLRLGRHVHHDSRSLLYPWKQSGEELKDVLLARHIGILDQGDVGSCTGNAETGALGTDPLYGALPPGRQAELNETLALALYSAAETIDGDGPYPPNDNGSTGLSVCKAAQNAGWISGFTHCLSLADVLDALSGGHAVILGTNWYDSMDSPASSGLVTISPGAQVRGGHEYLARGIDVANRLVRLDNSWGTGWGDQGSFAYSWDTLQRLLSEEGDGTVSVPLTQPAPVPVPPKPDPAVLLEQAAELIRGIAASAKKDIYEALSWLAKNNL